MFTDCCNQCNCGRAFPTGASVLLLSAWALVATCWNRVPVFLIPECKCWPRVGSALCVRRLVIFPGSSTNKRGLRVSSVFHLERGMRSYSRGDVKSQRTRLSENESFPCSRGALPMCLRPRVQLREKTSQHEPRDLEVVRACVPSRSCSARRVTFLNWRCILCIPYH